MSQKYIYVKLTKEWGGFQIGDVVRFGYNKGIGRIEKGEGVEVTKQKAVNDLAPIKNPRVETATAPPAAETAVVTPQVQDNKNEQANLQLSAKDIDKLKDNELKALAGKNNIDISKCKNIKEVQKAVKTALNIK